MKKLEKKYKDGRCGFVDENDTWLVEPLYKEEDLFSNESIVLVYETDLLKWGYIDVDGNYIEPQFDSAKKFSEDLAAVQYDNKFGYINKNGDYQIRPTFDSANDFIEGVAWVNVDNRFGLINKFGDYIIKPLFEEINDFNKGIAKVKLNGKWGYVDKNGNTVISNIYDNIYNFVNGFAMAQINDKSGWIDVNGNWYNRQPIHPKYSKKLLEESLNSIKSSDFILFGNDRIFSLDSPSEFIISGQRYHSIRQYLVAQKSLIFDNNNLYNKILAEKDLKQLLALENEIQNVDIQQWYRDRYLILREAVFAKFTQNQENKDYLISTEGKILVYGNSHDLEYGIEIEDQVTDFIHLNKLKGANLLGFILMEVRDEIIERQREKRSIEWKEEIIDEDTGELELVNCSKFNDKFLPSSKELWEEALKEEKFRIEYAKPISDNLKRYLYAHYDAVPIIKDIDNLKQGELEEFLNSYDPQRNHFSIEGPEWNDDKKWKARYGFDKEFYYSLGADSYSEALEIGVIEFIDSLYWEDEKGRHIDEHFIIRDK